MVLETEVVCVPFSPQQKLSSSVDRLSRVIQWTSAGRKQLQQDYRCSLEQVDRLKAQLHQGRELRTELEARVTQGQDQVARLEAQLKAQLDQGGRQEEEEPLDTLVARQQKSQRKKKQDRQNGVSGCLGPDQNLVKIYIYIPSPPPPFSLEVSWSRFCLNEKLWSNESLALLLVASYNTVAGSAALIIHTICLLPAGFKWPARALKSNP